MSRSFPWSSLLVCISAPDFVLVDTLRQRTGTSQRKKALIRVMTQEEAVLKAPRQEGCKSLDAQAAVSSRMVGNDGNASYAHFPIQGPLARGRLSTRSVASPTESLNF